MFVIPGNCFISCLPDSMPRRIQFTFVGSPLLMTRWLEAKSTSPTVSYYRHWVPLAGSRSPNLDLTAELWWAHPCLSVTGLFCWLLELILLKILSSSADWLSLRFYPLLIRNSSWVLFLLIPVRATVNPTLTSQPLNSSPSLQTCCFLEVLSTLQPSTF